MCEAPFGELLAAVTDSDTHGPQPETLFFQRPATTICHRLQARPSLSRSIVRSEEKIYDARDYLYKKVFESRMSMHVALRDEDIETAYVYLYGYRPGLREVFQSTLTRLKDAEECMFQNLQSAMQDETAGRSENQARMSCSSYDLICPRASFDHGTQCRSASAGVLVRGRRPALTGAGRAAGCSWFGSGTVLEAGLIAGRAEHNVCVERRA